MRDQKLFSKVTPYTLKSYDKYGNFLYASYGSRNETYIRQFRSDAVSTMPNAEGSYYRPTRYQAFYSTARYQPYKFRLKYPGGNYRDDEGEFYYTPYPNELTWGCTFSSSYSQEPIISFSTIQRARAELNRKVRNVDWNLGESVGEIRQSATLIGEVLNAYARSVITLYEWRRAGVRNVARASIREVKKRAKSGKIPKKLATGYVAFLYGVRPLMTDAYNMTAGLMQLMQNPNLANIYVNVPENVTELPTLWPSLEGYVTGVSKRGFKTGATIKIANPTAFTLDRFGITNPLSLAWELYTLSFVWDWFFHIKSFLDALIPPLGIVFANGYETKWLSNAISASLRPTWATTSQYQKVDIVTRAMSREVLLSLPIPIPYLDLELNFSQTTSLFALMVARS